MPSPPTDARPLSLQAPRRGVPCDGQFRRRWSSEEGHVRPTRRSITATILLARVYPTPSLHLAPPPPPLEELQGALRLPNDRPALKLPAPRGALSRETWPRAPSTHEGIAQTQGARDGSALQSTTCHPKPEPRLRPAAVVVAPPARRQNRTPAWSPCPALGLQTAGGASPALHTRHSPQPIPGHKAPRRRRAGAGAAAPASAQLRRAARTESRARRADSRRRPGPRARPSGRELAEKFGAREDSTPLRRRRDPAPASSSPWRSSCWARWRWGGKSLPQVQRQRDGRSQDVE
jgi:hypothetical protein